MDFNTININDWQAFLNNNDEILFHLENMYIANLEMITSTEGIDNILQTAYNELSKTKHMIINKKENINSLYDQLKACQKILSSKIGESTTKIIYGIFCAELGINNYNIDSNTQNYMNEILKGNISENDLADIAVITATFSPILAHAITKVEYKPTIIENSSLTVSSNVATSAISKGVSIFAKATQNEALESIVKSVSGPLISFSTAALSQMASKRIFNDIKLVDYDGKDITDVVGNSGLAVVEYFVSAALLSELGPVGIPVSIGVNKVIDYVVKPVINYTGDLITGNFEADSFEVDGKKYTIYYNGSGNHKSSSEILKKAKEKQENNRKRYYYIKGQAVPKAKFENELYNNTDSFINGEKEFNENNTNPLAVSVPTSYSEYSDVWNDMKNEIKQCKSAQEVSEVYNKYNSSSDYRWQTIDGEDTMITFRSLTESMENEYGFNPITYWAYIKE